MEFIKIIEQTQEFNGNLNEYLKTSLESDNKDICKGWDFLKTNLTKPLKEILNYFDYWNLVYNSKKENEILSYYLIKYAEKYDLSEELKQQLGSFVYVWNDIKRECEKIQEEQNLKDKLLNENYILIEDLTNKEKLKEINNLKVNCVFNRDKIGLLGSFENTESHEGKFLFDENRNLLFFVPKGHSRTGQILRSRFYYKEIKNYSKPL
jgi:hypothetical protein